MLIERIVRFLLPRQGQFFTLLEGLAAKIEAAAAVFGELAEAGRERLESAAARLKPIETEADQICHQLYQELDKTFVTPIDREDIAALTKALDDVIDDMEHAATFAVLYRFDALTEPMRQLVRITVGAAREVARAVGLLRQFSSPESIRATTIAVHNLENEADIVFRSAVAALFTDGFTPADIIRQKDMLESLEGGVDRCEDAMDVIRSVVVKNG
jgi:predicted phosphate transport protein (TIGR00153 family)